MVEKAILPSPTHVRIPTIGKSAQQKLSVVSKSLHFCGEILTGAIEQTHNAACKIDLRVFEGLQGFRVVTLPKKSICSWGSTRCWCIRKKTPVFLATMKRNASQSAPRGRKSNSTFAHACQNSDDREICPTEAVRGFEISAFLR